MLRKVHRTWVYEKWATWTRPSNWTELKPCTSVCWLWYNKHWQMKVMNKYQNMSKIVIQNCLKWKKKIKYWILKDMFIPANLYVYKQIQSTNTYIYIFIFIYIKMDIKMRKPSILDKQLVVQLRSLLHLLHWQATSLVSFIAGFHLLLLLFCLLFSDGSVRKESTCNAGGPGLIPGWERSAGEEWATHSSIVGLPCGSAGKESACNERDLGSIPGLGRSPGEEKGYPLQYSGLENSMNCIVHVVAKSWSQLRDFHFQFYFFHQSALINVTICYLCNFIWN